MKNKIKKNKGGFTLIEIMFYIALLVLLTLAVISALVSMTQYFKEVRIQTDFVGGASIVERISREVRQAGGISSITGSSLKLDSKDDLGNNKTVEFLLSGSNLGVLENNVLMGNLNASSLEITAISFIEITTTAGKAIKLSLSVKSTRDSTGRIQSFYDTIVLRGDYSS